MTELEGKPFSFLAGGIDHGPREVVQVRNALIRRREMELHRSNLLEGVILSHLITMLYHMGEHIWKEEWERAIKDETNNL